MRATLLCLAVSMACGDVLAADDDEPFHEPEDREVLLTKAADAETEPAARAEVDLSYRSRFKSSNPGKPGLGMYHRIEGDWSNLRLFMLAERDAGEARLLDFTTVNLEWRSGSRHLVIGDLRPGFAQGLLFARSTRGGRSLSLRSDSEHLGFRSTAENATVRGLAVRRTDRRGELIALAGRIAWDGRVSESKVTSLPTSGIHVTPVQRRGRKIVRAWTAGLRARRRSLAGFAVGVTLNCTRFAQALDLRRDDRTPWAFRGRRQCLGAADLRADGSRTDLATEIGADGGGRRGGLITIRMRLERTRLTLQVRHYDPGFHSFFGAAATSTTMQNERGYAASWSGRWSRLRWEISADQYAQLQPALLRPVPAPTNRLSLSTRTRAAGGQWRLLLQERRGSVWQSGRERRDLSRRLRLSHVRGDRGRDLTLRLEGHRAWRARHSETGASAAAIWRRKAGPISHVAHLTAYRTPSFLTRIYEYERDLPGAVSIRSMSGKGLRFYLLTGVVTGRLITGFRYRIEGPRDRRNFRQEIGLQIDWRS